MRSTARPALAMGEDGGNTSAQGGWHSDHTAGALDGLRTCINTDTWDSKDTSSRKQKQQAAAASSRSRGVKWHSHASLDLLPPPHHPRAPIQTNHPSLLKNILTHTHIQTTPQSTF